MKIKLSEIPVVLCHTADRCLILYKIDGKMSIINLIIYNKKFYEN